MSSNILLNCLGDVAKSIFYLVIAKNTHETASRNGRAAKSTLLQPLL